MEAPLAKELSPRAINLVALAWGLAEGTFFFFVPDVWLTWVALGTPRLAAVACLWAVAGAVAGGTLMYCWGRVDPATVLAALDAVPAISRAMCEQVGEQIRTGGVATMAVGTFSGVPYKIYAAQAGVNAVNLFAFLAMSVLARLSRFLLVTGIAAALFRFTPQWTTTRRRWVHVALWSLFYIGYFWVFRDPVD